MGKPFAVDQKAAARWTDDCQGRKDYDGRLVSINTRYWPRGGGFHISGPGISGLVSSEDIFPDVKPSASAAIHINCGEPDENGCNEDYAILVRAKFEAETFDEVKAQVEDWVQSQYKRIVTALLKEYGCEELRIE